LARIGTAAALFGAAGPASAVALPAPLVLPAQRPYVTQGEPPMLRKTVLIAALSCLLAHAGLALAASTVEMQTTQDTKLFFAPDKQIGVLKTGAQVKVIKEEGDWAFVRYVNDKIVVQGWVEKKYLAPITQEQVDPLGGLQHEQN
jgi:hypothetical protein